MLGAVLLCCAHNLYTPYLNFGMHWMKQNINKMKQHLKLQSKINCLMKKISSMNMKLYRLELVSGNKLQQIFTICHNARILILYCRCGSLSPSPSPLSSAPAAPWGCRQRVPLEKYTISTIKGTVARDFRPPLFSIK